MGSARGVRVGRERWEGAKQKRGITGGGEMATLGNRERWGKAGNNDSSREGGREGGRWGKLNRL